MRLILIAALFTALAGCQSNNSSDPNQAMDDTARMRDPLPVNLTLNPVKLTEKELPPATKPKGKLYEGWRWTDSLGENILVLSVAGPFREAIDGEDGKTVELHAAHYVAGDDNWLVKFSATDLERACPFDITANFIPGATTFTDLDRDGKAEVKLQYLLSCRSDVSNATMKLLMIEEGTSYGLTGYTWVPYNATMNFDVTEQTLNLAALPPLDDEEQIIYRNAGRYENEKAFSSAPAAFLPYARKEWLKYVMEKIGE